MEDSALEAVLEGASIIFVVGFGFGLFGIATGYGLCKLLNRPQTTKICKNPKCKNDKLVELETYNKKHCTVCGLRFDWFLDSGQKPRK